MSKRGLPASVQMRHDVHYVEELSRPNKTVGRVLPIDKIRPNPEQPRSEFGDLSELTASIKEKGVLEPLLVKPDGVGRWLIIAGERRWRASNLAGLKEVPCIELDLDERSVAEVALIENLQRKDLTIWEESDGLAALKEKFGYTNDEIAKKISKSRTTVTECMSIAGLPPAVRTAARERKINSKSTLLELARQFDEPAMFAVLDALDSGSKPKPAPRKQPGTADAKTPASAAVSASTTRGFAYDSDDFKLRITFATDAEPSKNRVLKALKQAFDEVKNGSADV